MQGTGRLSPDSRGLSLTSAACRTALLIALCGCQSTHVVQVNDAGQPQFERLSIVYEVVDPILPAGTVTQVTLADAQAKPFRTAWASRSAPFIEQDGEPQLRLTIVSPPPDGMSDNALMTLSAPGSQDGEWQTVATRSLPRRDVDLLLGHLVNGGLFDTEHRPLSSTRLAVEIDGVRTQKRWTREPRLDRLAVETYDAAR